MIIILGLSMVMAPFIIQAFYEYAHREPVSLKINMHILMHTNEGTGSLIFLGLGIILLAYGLLNLFL